MHDLFSSSQYTETLLAPPFEWCPIDAGLVVLADAADRGGTSGGVFAVRAFAISKYLITNAQYQPFVEAPEWVFQSCLVGLLAAGTPVEKDPSKSAGNRIRWPEGTPHTREIGLIAWPSVPGCHTPSVSTAQFSIHDVTTYPLPSEVEWQRAAVGDSSDPYPWGNAPVDQTRATCANWAKQPTSVDSHPAGKPVRRVWI